MDLLPEPKPAIETKSNGERAHNFGVNVLPAFNANNDQGRFFCDHNNLEYEDLENKKDERNFFTQSKSDSLEHFENENVEKENKMDVTETLKSDEKNDDETKFVNASLVLESKKKILNEEGMLMLENDFKLQINLQDGVSNEFPSVDNEENKMDVTENIKTDEKNDDETKYFANSSLLLESKKQVLDEKTGMLMTEYEFQQQNNYQDNVSNDGSNTSISDTSSSGIEKDFELLEDCVDMKTESKGELNEKVFKDSSSNQCHIGECSISDKETFIEKENTFSDDSGFEVIEQKNLINNEEGLKKNEITDSSHNSISQFNTITFPYMNPANAFDVVVPVIGKNVFPVSDIKPCKRGYHLADEINRLKGLEDAPYMPKLSYHEWRKQRDARPQETKDREERKKKLTSVKMAQYSIKLAVHILREMQNDNPDEKLIERWFYRFLRAPATPLSLLLSPQFVHVMMYIRGSSDFSQKLRGIADKCYLKCHVLFPIPVGYNFVTVYTSEVIKNIPQRLNGMHNFILDYDDFEVPDIESDDSAFSDEDDDEEI